MSTSTRRRSRYGRAAVVRAGLLVFGLTAALVGAIALTLDRGARRSAEQQQATQLAGAVRVSVSSIDALRADLRAQAGELASSLALQQALVAGDRRALERIAGARRARIVTGGSAFGTLSRGPKLAASATIDDGRRRLARVTIAVRLDESVLTLLRESTPLTGHMGLILLHDGQVLAGGPEGAHASVHDGKLVLGSTTFAAHTASLRDVDAGVVAVEPLSAIDERMLPYRRRLLLAAAITLALAAGLATVLGRPLARALGEVTRLRFQAQTDALTKLANRRSLDERLDDEVERARRLGTNLSFVIADLDGFKQINDRHGHTTGDAVLQAVARVFAETVRELDLAARYGGEELALVLPGTPLIGARRLAERIRAAVQALALKTVDGEPIEVTLSFGASSFPTHADATELVEAADTALYEAKQTGKNRVVTATARKKASARQVPSPA